eukprot:229573-Chlamydomonas_euryale.AAC.1
MKPALLCALPETSSCSRSSAPGMALRRITSMVRRCWKCSLAAPLTQFADCLIALQQEGLLGLGGTAGRHGLRGGSGLLLLYALYTYMYTLSGRQAE